MCDVKWLETLSLSTSYDSVITEESKPRQLHEVVTSSAEATSYLRTFYYRTLRLLFIIVTLVFLCN